MGDNADSPFHQGEREVQTRAGVLGEAEDVARKAIHDHMLDEHRASLSEVPLFVVGAADAAGRPWAAALVGVPGFVRANDERVFRVSSKPVYGDALEDVLTVGSKVGGLGINFAMRRRTRVNGDVIDRKSVV